MIDGDRTWFGAGAERRGFRVISAVALLALVVAFAGVGLGAGGVAAGDDAAVLEFDPDEVSVDPGDTVDVDVTLRSHGMAGQGVGAIDLQIDYPTEYLTVTHIEPNNWFEDAPDGGQIGEGQTDTEVSERTVYADENGAALFEQSLVNPEFGVIGTATVATVTVEVSEDADAATARMTTERTGVYPTRSQYSQPTPALPAEFDIAGGGSVVDPAFVEEPFADIDEDGADAEGDDEPDENGTDGTDEDGGDETDENGADGMASDTPETIGEDADDDVVAPLGAVVLGVLMTAFTLRHRTRR